MTAPRSEVLMRRQLDRRLNEVRDGIPLLQPPRGGWLATLRNALGMKQEILAQRMGVSRQAISQLEKREVEGSATLKALEQAAEALGGQLVYAIVPRKSLTSTLEERAHTLASRMVRESRHTMRLEDQEPASDMESRMHELAADLLQSPAELWSDPGGD